MIRDVREVSNYGVSIASGAVAGSSSVTKYAYNPAVGTTLEDVWSAGSTLTYQTSASALEAISSSVNDTDGGSGARSITIEGLDSNWDVATEVVTLNGTSASSPTGTSFIRVYRAYVNEVGSYGGVNDGTITVRVSGGGDTQAEIPLVDSVGVGQTLMSQYTIPRGFNACLVGMHAAIFTAKSVNIDLLFRLNANNTSTFSPWRTALHLPGSEGDNSLLPPVPFLFPQYTDIKIQAVTSTGTTEVSFDYQLILTEI